MKLLKLFLCISSLFMITKLFSMSRDEAVLNRVFSMNGNRDCGNEVVSVNLRCDATNLQLESANTKWILEDDEVRGLYNAAKRKGNIVRFNATVDELKNFMQEANDFFSGADDFFAEANQFFNFHENPSKKIIHPRNRIKVNKSLAELKSNWEQLKQDCGFSYSWWDRPIIKWKKSFAINPRQIGIFVGINAAIIATGYTLWKYFWKKKEAKKN